MYLLIDNYDSFTFNLYHFLSELGADVVVKRNDAVTVEEALALNPQGIVISPGPCDPDRAGICLDLVAAAAGRLPIFSVCLGHQCIGQHFGAKIVRAPKPMHGKISEITHEGGVIFDGIPNPFRATRYHSLTIDPDSVPDCLRITARSEDGVIQAVEHVDMPLYGVQFHPESIASDHGHAMLQNFLNISRPKVAA